MNQIIRRVLCWLLALYVASQTLMSVGYSTLFAYHPLLMVLGWLALVESVCSLPLRGTKAERAWQLNLHVYGEAIAICSLCLGAIVIYVNKERAVKSHLSSYHAWLGYSAIGTLLVQLGLGLYLHYYSSFSSETVVQRARSRKEIVDCHRLLGLLSVVIVGAALALVFESNYAISALHMSAIPGGSLPFHIAIGSATTSILYEFQSA
jgi:Eukaryotic cytochrome b561